MNAIATCTARPRLAALLAGAALLALATGPAGAAGEDHSGHGHAMHQMDHSQHGMQEMDHSKHVMPQGISRSEVSYALPDVVLIGTDGKPVKLAAAIDADVPVLVNFIFTSCTAICPLTTAVFSQVQDKLTAEGKPFRLVSISIDPEYDTPARLRDYAGKHKAGADWHFMTGDNATMVNVQRAFDAWRGGKMSHAPITFLRASPGSRWVRYDGLVDAKTLVAEYRQLAAGLKTARR